MLPLLPSPANVSVTREQVRGGTTSINVTKMMDVEVIAKLVVRKSLSGDIYELL